MELQYVYKKLGWR